MWPKYLDLKMEKGLVLDNDYWFVDIMTNVLYKYSFEEKKVHPMLDIPPLLNSRIKDRSYTIGAIYKRRVIIFPVAGDCIIEYDVESQKSQVIMLDFDDISDECEVEKDFKFRSCVLVENELWLIPAACHHIISIDLDTNEINNHTEWYDAFQGNDWQNKYLFGMGKYHKNSIWFPCLHANIVVEFDIRNNLARLHEIGMPSNIYSAICFLSGQLFVLECTLKKVYKVDENDDIIAEYDLPDQYDIDKAFMSVANGDKVSCCSIMESVGDQIIGLPCYGNSFFVFSDKEKNVMLIPKVRQEDIYISSVCFDDSLIIPSQNMGKVDIFDVRTHSLNNLVDKFLNYRDVDNYDRVVIEGNNGLEELIEYVIYTKNDDFLTERTDNGYQIYKSLGE